MYGHGKLASWSCWEDSDCHGDLTVVLKPHIYTSKGMIECEVQ